MNRPIPGNPGNKKRFNSAGAPSGSVGQTVAAHKAPAEPSVCLFIAANEIRQLAACADRPSAGRLAHFWWRPHAIGLVASAGIPTAAVISTE